MGWIIERGMVPVNCEIAIFDLKGALAPQDKPLMLQPVLFCPVLTWAAQELMDCGVQRYFIVCPENCRQEVLDDLPGCDVTFFDDTEAALSAAGGDVVMVPGPVVPVYGPEDGRSVYAADSQVLLARLRAGTPLTDCPAEAAGVRSLWRPQTLAPAFRPFDSAAAPRRHLCGPPVLCGPGRDPAAGDHPAGTHRRGPGQRDRSQLHAPGLPDRPVHHRECLPAQ